MIFPLNLSSAGVVLIALEARGVTAERLAHAIAVPEDDAARMLATHEARLTVTQAKGVERLAGVSFVTLAMEGYYVRFAQDPERLAELDEAAAMFPDIRSELVHRAAPRPSVKTKRRPASVAGRRRAS